MTRARTFRRASGEVAGPSCRGMERCRGAATRFFNSPQPWKVLPERPMALPIGTSFEPMNALLVADLPAGGDWQYEPKWDGFRGLAFRGGRVAARRGGRPLRARRRAGHPRRIRPLVRGPAAAHPPLGVTHHQAVAA